MSRKKLRERKRSHDLDLAEALETEDWRQDCRRRERKAKGPSPEAEKLLKRKPR
jgi:hypothetical protein